MVEIHRRPGELAGGGEPGVGADVAVGDAVTTAISVHPTESRERKVKPIRR
jgi:hypothetical protein